MHSLLFIVAQPVAALLTGALIIGFAQIGIIFAGWDSNWYFTFLGVILFLAVAVNTLVRRRAMAARR